MAADRTKRLAVRDHAEVADRPRQGDGAAAGHRLSERVWSHHPGKRFQRLRRKDDDRDACGDGCGQSSSHRRAQGRIRARMLFDDRFPDGRRLRQPWHGITGITVTVLECSLLALTGTIRVWCTLSVEDYVHWSAWRLTSPATNYFVGTAAAIR